MYDGTPAAENARYLEKCQKYGCAYLLIHEDYPVEADLFAALQSPPEAAIMIASESEKE